MRVSHSRACFLSVMGISPVRARRWPELRDEHSTVTRANSQLRIREIERANRRISEMILGNTGS